MPYLFIIFQFEEEEIIENLVCFLSFNRYIDEEYYERFLNTIGINARQYLNEILKNYDNLNLLDRKGPFVLPEIFFSNIYY